MLELKDSEEGVLTVLVIGVGGVLGLLGVLGVLSPLVGSNERPLAVR